MSEPCDRKIMSCIWLLHHLSEFLVLLKMICLLTWLCPPFRQTDSQNEFHFFLITYSVWKFQSHGAPVTGQQCLAWRECLQICLTLSNESLPIRLTWLFMAQDILPDRYQPPLESLIPDSLWECPSLLRCQTPWLKTFLSDRCLIFGDLLETFLNMRHIRPVYLSPTSLL